MLGLRRARNAFIHVRHHGLRNTARYAIERTREMYHEWRLGIRTTGKVQPEELGIQNPFAFEYYPSDYASIYRAFGRLAIRPGEDGFLDYGCGMGRVLVVAGTYPFRRVIGVELSPELGGVARENLRRAQRKLKCQHAEVVTADAASYQVPAEVNFVFFYNPFHGPVLSSALTAIRTSLNQTPRKLFIVFKNTTHLEPVMNEHTWLSKHDEFPACDSDHKVMILEGRAS